MTKKYNVTWSTRFKHDLKIAKKRGYNLRLLEEVVDILIKEGSLPSKYHPHLLSGKFNNCWECHITPDWLLLYEIYEDKLILCLLQAGTHSDLF